MNIKTTLKSSVAAAALFAVVAPAQAGTVSNGNDTASVTLSGHFNKMLMWMDSGDASRLTIAGNHNSETRARIVVKGKLNEAVSVGAVSEYAMETNRTSSVSPANTAGTGNPEVGSDGYFTKRHTYVKFDHKQFGSVRLGWTSEANDSITEMNMTGATDVVYGGNILVGGAINLQRTNAAPGVFTTTTVGSLFENAGEGGRTDTVRYDTPTVGGFTAAASFQADQSSSAAIRWGAKFGAFKVQAGYGGTNESAASTTQELTHGGSVAVGHDSGFSVRAKYGQTEFKGATRDESELWSFGAGYKAKLISAGNTNFAFDYILSENASANGDEMVMYNIGVEQETDAGVKFYLGYQLFQGEQAGGVDYEDASTILAGTKVFF